MVSGSSQDEYYFPPGSSVARRVHGERAVGLLYGQRALLIGALEPLTYTGTMLSTKSADHPFERLARTAKLQETVLLGTRTEADEALGRVLRLHEGISGTLPEAAGAHPAGTPYSAFDPQLMLWTLAVIADSGREMYETMVRPLSEDDREALWQDYVRFGELFGLPRSEVPVTHLEFREWWEEKLASPDLHATPHALEFAPLVAFEQPVPTAARGNLKVQNMVIKGTLPPRVREIFGIEWGVAQERAFRAFTAAHRRTQRLLPRQVRRGRNDVFFEVVARTERQRGGTRTPPQPVVALLVALVMACLSLIALAPSRAAAALDAETMLSPETVTVIDLQLPEASIEALETEPRDYVEGTFAIAETAGTPATVGAFSTPLTVGVRLKGSVGSFQGLDSKAAFKIKFNSFVSGQKYLGLKKLTLNNMVQDDSMIHEVLTYEAFRAAGIHAPRTGYAYVYVNGVDYGLHLNLETVDDVALKRWFGSFKDPQHLYEGTPWKDLRPENLHQFEVDEGDENDLSDLEALIAATAAPSPSFSERMAPVADLDQLTRFWAAERYLGHWDGYSGGVVNNYYLLSDQHGVFQMLPWGTDQTLTRWRYPFADSGGRLFEQCLAEPSCAEDYREALVSVADSTSALDLVPRAEGLAARLAPWQAKEWAESARATVPPTVSAAAVDETLQFLVKRPGALVEWLETGEIAAEPDPEPEPEDEEKSDRNTGKTASDEARPSAAVAPKPATIVPRVNVDRTQLPQGQVLARVAVTGPGTISLVGEIGAGAARRRACAATVQMADAGSAALRCRLSRAARRHLKSRSLALRIRARFLPADGSTERTVNHTARLPRQKPR